MFDKIKFAKILSNINDTYDTMTEFSEKSGVNRTYLSQYINQKLDSPPSPKVLLKIANNSNEITSYEELMNICGFLISKRNPPLINLKKANETLQYNNLIKNIKFTIEEKELINELIDYFEKNYNKDDSLEENEKNALLFLDNKNTNNIDISNIKKGLSLYILSRSSNIITNEVYERTTTLDTAYNYVDTLTKFNMLSHELMSDNIIPKYYMCPVYGQISAGQPNWVEECIEGYLPIDPNLMGIINPEEHYFLRVNGESMNKVVKNGAFALIHKQDTVENGEIAVVLVNRI